MYFNFSFINFQASEVKPTTLQQSLVQGVALKASYGKVQVKIIYTLYPKLSCTVYQKNWDAKSVNTPCKKLASISYNSSIKVI